MEPMEWIKSREPRPPAALVARMERALDEIPAPEPQSISSQLLAVAIGILARGDASAASGRALAALDLLAADALITYAMESASDDCASIAAAAESAIRTICSLEKFPHDR